MLVACLIDIVVDVALSVVFVFLSFLCCCSLWLRVCDVCVLLSCVLCLLVCLVLCLLFMFGCRCVAFDFVVL